MKKHDSVQLRHQYEMPEFQGYSLSIANEQALEELRSHHEIEYIETNMMASIEETQVRAPWNLARISQRSFQSSNYVYDNRAGQGVDVYVLDTGVNLKHVEFGGRAIFGASFNGYSGAGDLHGHGTHVAGTVASRAYGVAKAATIIDVAVMGRDGTGPWDQVLAGLQWTVRSCQARKRPCVAKCVHSHSLVEPNFFFVACRCLDPDPPRSTL
jgi:cerevisin